MIWGRENPCVHVLSVFSLSSIPALPESQGVMYPFIMRSRTLVGDLSCVSSYVPFLKLAPCIASHMCFRKAELSDFSS